MNARILMAMLSVVCLAPTVLAQEASVEIRAASAGVVERVNIASGAHVKKGDVVVQFDTRAQQDHLKLTMAEVAHAATLLDQYRVDLERAQRLVKERAIAKAEFDEIVARHSKAQAELQVARIDRDLANLAVEQARIVASADGKLTQLKVTVGSKIKAGDVIGTIEVAPAAQTTAKVKDLLKERHAVLTKALELQMKGVKESKILLPEMVPFHRAALEAGLELCDTPAERVTQLHKDVQFSENLLKIAETRLKAGLSPQAEVLLVQAHVLEIRIRLAREEANAKPAK